MLTSEFTNESVVLLVADAHADAWRRLLHQMGPARIETIGNVALLPQHAGPKVAMVCICAELAAQNSISYFQNALAAVRLAPHVSIVLLARDGSAGDRFRAQAGLPPVLVSSTQDARTIELLRELHSRHALQTQVQLFTAALDGATTGLVVVDPHTPTLPIMYANAEFLRVTGYNVEDVIGRSCHLLEGAETDAEIATQLHDALAAGREHSTELIHYRKDGSPFWNKLGVRPVRAGDGRLQYLVVTQEDVSERRRIRERLRASEARLELAMSASGIAMWDWNVVTGEIYYNDQWQALLDVPAEELLLRDSLAARLALPEDDASIFADLERHLAGDSPRFEREFELRSSSGKSKSVMARADVVRRDADGQPLRVIGVWRDVTARKQNLRAIEETHKRWERAVAGTSDGLFDWDLVTGYVWYAPRFREQLGYTEQEMNDTFTAFQRVLHDEERLTVLSKIRSHLEQRTQLDLDCRVRCKTGEYRWFRLRGNAERDAAGRPRRLSGSIRDISGQIDAEQALHRSEDFYGTILNALPVTVAYIDRDERVIYANRASSELLATPPDRLCGSLMRDVLQPDLVAEIAPPLAAAFRNEVIERQIRTQDVHGQAMDIDITYLPHSDEGGEVQGCFVVARNVTTRLRLEAELRQSQKMEAIGRLTGGVAHDFNNLLSVAIGNAQLLSRTLKDSPRLHKQAETILRAAMRGAELTRRLLTFARQQESIVQVAKVNEIITGMYELLRRTLPGDIELRLELGDSCSTRIDPGQFENALLNLVINARDAMPQGGSIAIRSVPVTVNEQVAEVSERMATGPYVLVTITDSGFGMQPETLRRVFEPFFTTKESGKGSGLGLAMVHGFIKGCSGYVAIKSTPGAGTQVQLYFPRERDAEVELRDTAHSAVELPRGAETILVVDDNADVRATAVEMLASLGYRVLEATNGRTALAIAESERRIDLLFSDVMLPGGVSSQALIRKLREVCPRVKPLLTSGFSDSVLLHRSMLDGSIELLAKPYELNDLARRVRAVLDSEQEKVRVPA
jgi:PAS domain S-box-containing protein